MYNKNTLDWCVTCEFYVQLIITHTQHVVTTYGTNLKFLDW